MCLLSVIHCFQTTPRAKPYPVAVCAKLPHILFPIGKGNNGAPWQHQTHLRAVFDSGAGASLGYLPYFQDLHSKFPHLFSEFCEINPQLHSQLFVGNIDKDCEASNCSHYAEMHTPFFDFGRPVTWRFALSSNFSVNAIMGLPFIVTSKMVAHFADGYCHSGVFQTNFRLEFMQPSLQDSVPQQDGQTPTFMSQAQQKKSSKSVTVLDPSNPKATSR